MNDEKVFNVVLGWVTPEENRRFFCDAFEERVGEARRFFHPPEDRPPAFVYDMVEPNDLIQRPEGPEAH